MRLLLAIALLGADALGAGPWLRIASPHFELFTTAAERRGRDAVGHLERVRDFLGEAFGSSFGSVRVVAFQSHKEFEPYRLNPLATAYFLAGDDRDYIVLSRLDEAGLRTAAHECVHLAAARAGRRHPLWLEEGLAELYSTLRVGAARGVFGALIPGRCHLLRSGRWLDLETLLAVRQGSALLSNRAFAEMFYAQSWALVHMLHLDPEYRAGFDRLLDWLAAGTAPGAAFERAYGRPLRRVRQDLERYVRSERLNLGSFRAKPEHRAPPPRVEALDAVESGLLLAGLLAACRKDDQARAAYLKLADALPESAPAFLQYDLSEAHRRLGLLRLGEGRYDDALRHLARVRLAAARKAVDEARTPEERSAAEAPSPTVAGK